MNKPVTILSLFAILAVSALILTYNQALFSRSSEPTTPATTLTTIIPATATTTTTTTTTTPPETMLTPTTTPPATTTTTTTTWYVELGKYSGWKGVESMVTPLDEYAKSVLGAGATFDLLWPYADSQNPFRDAVDRGVGVAIITILSIKNISRYDIYAHVVYNARIDRVIVKPVNTITPPPETVCIKNPEICELARNQSRVVDNLISTIRESNVIDLSVPAFIARDSTGKTELTISDIASPFPLLEPGYQYLVFITPELDGIHIYYDYVWGPWAYLVQDGKVYSLNYIKPPANVSLDPTRLFSGSTLIYWKPYPYEQLREIAVGKLSASGEPLENFVSRITG
ncbi:hypothetical protein ACSU1N_02465 [Thermogladius sp. 4427co]|uniref:hypothetical protein n=1 Tax=Thermogladius sp. 4427co TaxID=3450718 RepID=UPI003F78B719